MHSPLQRHSTATLAQVGTPKVISCAESFNSFAPWVEVDPRIELFSKEMADELLEGKSVPEVSRLFFTGGGARRTN